MFVVRFPEKYVIAFRQGLWGTNVSVVTISTKAAIRRLKFRYVTIKKKKEHAGKKDKEVSKFRGSAACNLSRAAGC